MSRTSSGCAAAFLPITKKVALTPAAVEEVEDRGRVLGARAVVEGERDARAPRGARATRRRRTCRGGGRPRRCRGARRRRRGRRARRESGTGPRMTERPKRERAPAVRDVEEDPRERHGGLLLRAASCRPRRRARLRPRPGSSGPAAMRCCPSCRCLVRPWRGGLARSPGVVVGLVEAAEQGGDRRERASWRSRPSAGVLRRERAEGEGQRASQQPGRAAAMRPRARSAPTTAFVPASILASFAQMGLPAMRPTSTPVTAAARYARMAPGGAPSPA